MEIFTIANLDQAFLISTGAKSKAGQNTANKHLSEFLSDPADEDAQIFDWQFFFKDNKIILDDKIRDFNVHSAPKIMFMLYMKIILLLSLTFEKLQISKPSTKIVHNTTWKETQEPCASAFTSSHEKDRFGMFSASNKDMMQQMAAMMADRFRKSTPYSKRFSKSLQQGKVESNLPLSQRSPASSELAAP